MKIDSKIHRIRSAYSYIFPSQILVNNGKTFLSAITFDDGPCPGNTEKILSILDDNNIKATFFISGQEADKYHKLVKLIFNAGHQLANHGYFHKTIDELGTDNYINGVNKTHEILEDAASANISKVFRPPYGEMRLLVTYKLIRLGYQYVLWSYDTRDSYLDSAEKIINHMADNPPRSGEIFLMHDDYERLSDALPELITLLKERGSEFCRIDEIHA